MEKSVKLGHQSPIKLGEAGAVPAKVQLLRVGKFDSDYYGPFEITKEILASLKKNFDDNVRGYEDKKLPIDYFHESDRVAAGWIEELELSADALSLWAVVKWTSKAVEAIAQGELRYLSAEFSFNYVSNEGKKEYGPTLFGAGLTNRPFVEGMKAVVSFTEGGKSQMTLEQAMAKIAELEAEIAKLKGDGEAMAKKYDESAAKCTALETELGKGKEQAKLAEQKADFDKLMLEGKAVEAQREAYMAGDMVKFITLAQPTNMGAKGKEVPAEKPAVEGSYDERVVKLALEKLRAGNVSMQRAISEVLNENKDLAADHLKATAVR